MGYVVLYFFAHKLQLGNINMKSMSIVVLSLTGSTKQSLARCGQYELYECIIKNMLISTAFLLFLQFLFTAEARPLILFLLLFQPYLRQNALRQPFEYFLNIAGLFSACLQERKVVFLGQLFALLTTHFPLRLQIRFRPHQDHLHIRVAVLLDLVYPAFYMFEAEVVGDGIGEHNAVGAFIKRFGDVSKALLSCCIPDIQGDLMVIELDSFDFEIDADGTKVIVLIGILTVAYQYACLANPAITNHQKLQSVVFLAAHSIIVQCRLKYNHALPLIIHQHHSNQSHFCLLHHTLPYLYPSLYYLSHLKP